MRIQYYIVISSICSLALFCVSCGSLKSGKNASAAKEHVGLQLYSLRADFAKDVPGTLKLTRDLGVKYVELASTYNQTPEKFKALLDENGLKPIAAHFPYERFRNDADGVALEAKALGLQYVGCAWITHKGDFDENTCREAIRVFNHAGEVMAKSGIKFFYHTHGYEFQPYANGTLFDLLLTGTDPKLVTYEMDILWIVYPGRDPVQILEKYKDRFELLHVKDLKKGVKGDLTGHTDVRNDVALGTGQINLPAVLRKARDIGVKWYFIEDESPSSKEQLPESLAYLKQLDW